MKKIKIHFYAPLKPISSPIPSGDREIARGIYGFFLKSGNEVEVVSEFSTWFFWASFFGILYYPFALMRAIVRAFLYRPDIFFTYHLYHKAPDPILPILSFLFQRPHFVFEGIYGRSFSKKIHLWPGWFFSHLGLSRAAHVFSDKRADLEGLRLVLPENKISHIPPAIDTQNYSRDLVARNKIRSSLEVGERTLVVGVAMLRMDRKNAGVLFLLECLSELELEGFEFDYLHIGDGECFEETKKIATSKLKRAHFIGRKDPSEIKAYLSAADFFAFPGIGEAIGMVYLEAQACELPVIAFSNGGIPEVVSDGKTGFLSELMNKDEMKKTLRILFKDKQLRAQMGKNARESVVKNFDINKNYKKMLDIIHQSLERS